MSPRLSAIAILAALGCSSSAAHDAGVVDASGADVPSASDAASDLGASVDAADSHVSTGTECDPFATNAPCGSGLVCAAVFTISGGNVVATAYECVNNASPVAMGQPCSSLTVSLTPQRSASNCGPQLVCVSTVGSAAGQCQPLCTMERSTCASGDVCTPLTDVGDVGGCVPLPATCDPVAQTGCSASTACYLEYLYGSTVAACLSPSPPATAIAENGACSDGGCAAGFTCYPDDADAGVGVGHCRRFCAPGGSTNSCAAATPHCDMITTVGTAGSVGVCLAM